jgi:hypothetical protein
LFINNGSLSLGSSVEKVRKPSKGKIFPVSTTVSPPETGATNQPSTILPLTDMPTILPSAITTLRSAQAGDVTTASGKSRDEAGTTTLKAITQETVEDSFGKTTTVQQSVVEATEMVPAVLMDSLDTLSAPESDGSQPAVAPQPTTAAAPPPTTLGTTTAFGIGDAGGTTLSPAIREMVDEFTNGIHAAAPEKLSPTALETIRKNFEQKKNIFEQFVSFGAQDKAFVPNSEVFTSDWSARADPVAVEKAADLSGRTEPTSAAAATSTSAGVTTLAANVGRQGSAGSKSAPERNAEGGFKPMIKPLFSPLS